MSPTWTRDHNKLSCLLQFIKRLRASGRPCITPWRRMFNLMHMLVAKVTAISIYNKVLPLFGNQKYRSAMSSTSITTPTSHLGEQRLVIAAFFAFENLFNLLRRSRYKCSGDPSDTFGLTPPSPHNRLSEQTRWVKVWTFWILDPGHDDAASLHFCQCAGCLRKKKITQAVKTSWC